MKIFLILILKNNLILELFSDEINYISLKF